MVDMIEAVNGISQKDFMQELEMRDVQETNYQGLNQTLHSSLESLAESINDS